MNQGGVVEGGVGPATIELGEMRAHLDLPRTHVDDMYVDAGLSLQTARAVGNVDVWITNEFEHDGIRQSGAVFDRLVAMVADKGGPLKAG